MNLQTDRDRLKVMFIRQSEGVYKFGTKKVAIKIEKGDQLLLRVGGGYMKISKFIETYTLQELDKLERSNALVKFQRKVQYDNSPSITSPNRPNSWQQQPNLQNAQYQYGNGKTKSKSRGRFVH